MKTTRKRGCLHRRRLRFEPLEDRCLLAVSLDLSASIVPAPLLDTNSLPINVIASNDPAAHQSEMSLDVDPTNSLHLVGISSKRGPSQTPINVFRSFDGGANWQATVIDGDIENLGIGVAERRFDPSIAFDSAGNLYISYLHATSGGTFTTNHLIVARSSDGGATFSFRSAANASVPFLGDSVIALDKPMLATGPDGTILGNEAVYIAYTELVPLTTTKIMVAGDDFLL